MATYVITGPDGKRYQITGESPEGALAALQQMLGDTPDAGPSRSQQLTDQAMAAQRAGNHDEARRLINEASYAAVQDGETPDSVAYNPATGRMEDMALRGDRGRMSAAAQGLGQGVSFGAMDEVVGGLYGLTGPGSYEQNRDYALASMRGDLESARDNYPVTAIGAEVAGGALSSIGAGSALGLGRQATTGARAIEGAKVGAMEGGLYGFMAGEDGPMNRLAGAARGAGIGGAAGAAAPWAMEGGRRLWDNTLGGAVASMRTAPNATRASRAVQRVVDRSGRSVDELEQAIRQAALEGQPMYNLADATGNSGQRMLSGVARSPGEARQEIAEYLINRQGGQGARVSGFVDDALNAPRNTGNLPVIPGQNPADFTGMTGQQVSQNLTGARDRAANVAYNAAREGAGPVDVRSALSVIDDRIGPMQGSGVTGDGIDASLSRYRGRLAAQPGGEAFSGASSVELSDFNRVLGVKQDLSDEIGRAVRAGENNKARELINLRDALDQALEAASPAYRQANDDFARASRVIEQVEAGSAATAPRNRASDTVQRYSGLSADEQAAFRSGYGDRVLGRIEADAPGVNSVRRLTTPKSAEELAAMARDPDMLARQLSRESDMFATSNAALGGSRTADNLADIAEVGAFDASPIINALTGNWRTAAQQMGTQAVNALTGRNEATRDLIARMLLSDDVRNALAPAAQATIDRLPIVNALEAITRSGERALNPLR